MITELTIPKIGYTMEEATLTMWLKNEGDRVEQGETVAEIESDKATSALESPVGGWLRRRLYEEGDIVPVTQCIAWIGGLDDPLPGEAAASMPVATMPQPGSAAAPAGLVSPTPVDGGTTRLSPRARKFAAENNIDVSKVPLQGSGVGGIIVERDIRSLQAVKAPPAPSGSIETQPERTVQKGTDGPDAPTVSAVSAYRLAAAKRLTRSAQEIPQFIVGVDADATALLSLKERLSGGTDKKVSMTALLVKCAAQAIAENRNVNASWNDGNLLIFDRISICVAIATDVGLVAPVIHDAGAKGVYAIQSEIAELAHKAKEGVLTPEDISSGTFTVSNLGMFGVDSFEAIINPPQSAILAVGSAIKKPVVLESGKIVAKPMMRLNLTSDHRVLDGADAARFLGCIRRYVEQPELLIG